MSAIVTANNLSKQYGDLRALDNVDFTINAGQIVGLLGPNGAGKTTALKTILGLASYTGQLEVLGLDPRRYRHRIMQEVSFIADVALLPRWLRVDQSLEIMQKMHPRFDLAKAERFISNTSIKRKSKIKTLSKGMVTQLHLALVMAIDARLLVLDEPTIGLDIIYRKEFYAALLEDYFDEEKTIIVSTHQVEEIQHILTNLMFINEGKLILNASMEDIADRFVEVSVSPENLQQALDLKPIYKQDGFGQTTLLYEGVSQDRLAQVGTIGTPNIANLFVAKVKEKAA